jgi:hypothetical protein
LGVPTSDFNQWQILLMAGHRQFLVLPRAHLYPPGTSLARVLSGKQKYPGPGERLEGTVPDDWVPTIRTFKEMPGSKNHIKNPRAILTTSVIDSVVMVTGDVFEPFHRGAGGGRKEFRFFAGRSSAEEDERLGRPQQAPRQHHRRWQGQQRRVKHVNI